MKINCSHTKLLELHKIQPNPKNPNQHPKKQIELLAKIIDYQGQRSPVVVSNRSGFIVKGHGRLEAIKKLGWEMAAVDFQDYESEAQEYADMIADNKIAELAETDMAMVNNLALDFGPDFDLDLLGIPDFELKPGGTDEFGVNLDTYTKKIKTPVYEPKGEKPKVSELYDLAKTQELLGAIRKEKLPEDVKIFLEMASYRHTVFNYEKIAEFYAHASPEQQELMESSALVIIDFQKAIENGFVVLTNEIAEAYTDAEE